MVHSAPQRREICLDASFDQGSGWQEIHAAHAFEGTDLRFSVILGRAGIDAETGVLRVPTNQPHSGETIKVQAWNALGKAYVEIQVVVEDDGVRATIRRAREIEFDGIRFRFSRPVGYGNFISGGDGAGDLFVIGPVTLESYSPGPVVRFDGREMNGAMLNPRCGTSVGFDSLSSRTAYLRELNVGLAMPLELQPGDSLIVATSNPDATRSRDVAGHFVVLTCLAKAPFLDSFRPPYSGPDRTIWRLSDIRTDRLLALKGVGRKLGAADRTLYEDRFRRFSIDFSPSWLRNHLESEKHQPLYGRDLCHYESEPYLWIHGDQSQSDKVDVLIGLVQNGIDRYGVFQSAREQGFHPWRADGAHNSGRKFSILHAGHLLDDPGMLAVMAQSAELEGAFQEDGMTFFVTPELLALTNSSAWRPPYRDDASVPKQPYSTGMIGIPDWRGRDSLAQSNAAWTGHPYRIAGNNNTQHAQVLLILALGLRAAWGHEAYIDYHMRFCEIMAGRPDPWRFQGGRRALYNPVAGSQRQPSWKDWQRRWRSELSWQMLMEHRSAYYDWPWIG